MLWNQVSIVPTVIASFNIDLTGSGRYAIAVPVDHQVEVSESMQILYASARYILMDLSWSFALQLSHHSYSSKLVGSTNRRTRRTRRKQPDIYASKQ